MRKIKLALTYAGVALFIIPAVPFLVCLLFLNDMLSDDKGYEID